MNKWLLHYDCIDEFNHQFNNDLLTTEELKGGLIELSPVRYEGGMEEGAIWGWVFEKNGTKYLLSSRNDKGEEIKLKNILPIKAKSTIRVSCKGNIYKWIKQPVSQKFRPLKHMNFPEFVDTLSCWKGTNPDHQKLLWMIGLTMAFDRSYFRVCSPPGLGKDSVIDTIGNLFIKAATVENPTIAKYEEMVYLYNLVGVNEVSNLSKADWRKLQIALLATCAFKPMLTKQSKAHGNVGSYIPLRNTSVSVTFNDITNKRDITSYFDLRADDELLDRLPAFRLYSHYTEDFDGIKDFKVKDFVSKNIDEYKKLISTFWYYKDNLPYHGWKVKELIPMSNRWKTSVRKLLKTVDANSNTQEEFDRWIAIINKSMIDYKEMVKYPKLYDDLTERINKKIHDPELFKEKIDELNKVLSKMDTFIDKNSYIKRYNINTEKTVREIPLEGFW